MKNHSESVHKHTEHESNKNWLWRLTTVSALSAIALTGCAADETPKDTAGESSELINNQEVEAQHPAFIERIKDMEVEEFVELPRDDQLTWVNYWREQYEPTYNEYYQMEPYYQKWTTPSASNSDREILENLNHIMHLAHMTPANYDFATSENEDDEIAAEVDLNQGKKMISGFIYKHTPNRGVVKPMYENLDFYSGRSAIDGPMDYLSSSPIEGQEFNPVLPDFTGSNFECRDDTTDTSTLCRSMDVRENANTNIGNLRVILVDYQDQISNSQQQHWLAIARD